MLPFRRARLVLGCLAAVAVSALAFHAFLQPVTPGRSLSWVATPTPSPGQGTADSTPTAPGVARATASPAPGNTSSGPLAGLRAPLSALLQHLNADTAHNASGQYSILQTIENALRDRIDQLLNWIVGKH